MSDTVRIFAPATVANVGPAFDVLGFALNTPGDEIIVTRSRSAGVTITKIEGEGGRLPQEATKNTAGVAALGLLKFARADFGVELHIKKGMPLGSGLGSSAASAVGALFGINELLERRLSREELLPFAMEAERAACGVAHADNVAPGLLGGFALIRSYNPLDVIKLPTPAELWCAVVHPLIEIRTEDARRILKKEIAMQAAIIQWGNIAGLIAGITQSDYDLISRSLNDTIVEPTRSLLIPGFDKVKESALANGALGCSLSGSGPSIFALSRGEANAARAGEAMIKAFSDSGIESEIFVSKVNTEGPTIL